MGLLDDLFRRRSKTRNFAEGTSISEVKGQGMTDVGVSGDSMLGFEGSEAKSDNLSIDQYVKMRQKDGTVAALYNILTLPIIGNSWKIEADEADSNDEQADLVRGNLMDPPHKGGMEVPLSLVVADMLRATLEGFRLFELIYMVNDDGKIVYQRLASRDSRTLLLIRADNGTYGGAVQRANFKGEYHEVTIPAWKTFLFTFGKDKNYLYGESAFKPAYYHFDRIHRLYYLTELSAQARAIPPMTAQATDLEADESKERRTSLMSALNKFGRLRPNIYIPKGYTVAAADMGRGQIDLLPHISHHKTEMARSFLAQFLMLGTSGTRSVGSWALSENHQDIFITALKGLMQNIEDHINFYLIPNLIDLNFSSPAYPTFKFDDMTSDAKTIMQTAFTALIQAGKVSDAMAKGVEDMVANSLDINLEDIEDQLEKAAKEEQAEQEANPDRIPPTDPNQPPPPPQPPTQPQPPAGPPPGQKKNSLSDQQWFRPLTPAEKRINFTQIQSRYDSLEQQFEADIKPVFDKIKNDAVTRLKALLESGSLSALGDFQLRYANDYQAAVAKAMRDAYEYAKKGCADELHVPSPATSRDTSTLINQNAQAVASKQLSDLLFLVKAEVIKDMRKNQLSEHQLGLLDVLAAVSAAFGTFFDKKVSLLGTAIIAQGINRGRADVFEADQQNIYGYQYSAILDGLTCPICEDLDSTVLDYADYLATEWQPPIHLNCRCIWAAILNTEEAPPAYDSFPDAPGGVMAPSL